MIPRRRFLQLCAACAASPAAAFTARWDGYALGAQVSVTLHGPQAATEAALAEIPALLDRIEAQFSLYRPTSALSELNRTSRLTPDAPFRQLLAITSRAFRVTGGLFDPTVQPLWQALAQGLDGAAARARVGWGGVRSGADGTLRLSPGQALTFNGIAQGFATDRVRDALARRGFSHALIDIGEQAALGGPFRLGVLDPRHGLLGQHSLSDGAIATSSAAGPGQGPHLIAPDGRAPLWSSVGIEAARAAWADALSTAAVFLPLPELVRLKSVAGLRRITAVDADGNLRTL